MKTLTIDADRLELLAQVASWYYEENLSQEEIAQRLGRSISMISRMLQEARDSDLVEIRVRYPSRTDPQLEDRLCESFGLSYARVLPNPWIDQNTSILRRLGDLGARFLQQQLHDGIRIGLSWGTNVYEVVSAMPNLRVRDALVIQISGAVGSSDPTVDGAQMARWLAEKLNASSRFLHAPLIVENKTIAQALLRDRTNMETLGLISRIEVALVGIGTTDPLSAGLQRAGYVTEADVTILRKAGAVGDIVGYHLNADGSPLDISFNQRVVGIDLDTLRSVPLVIAVAHGASKVPAILAVLRGEYIDALVTDVTTASNVLHLHDSFSDLE